MREIYRFLAWLGSTALDRTRHCFSIVASSPFPDCVCVTGGVVASSPFPDSVCVCVREWVWGVGGAPVRLSTSSRSYP